MKEILESLKKGTNQVGVKASIWVTAFSIVMLIVALLGIEFDLDQAEAICFFALIVQLVYGVVLCFSFLKNNRTACQYILIKLRQKKDGLRKATKF